MTRIALPALLIMLAVVGFVGAAGWNASSDPRLVMTLTERELPLPSIGVRADEDPGLQLRIAYQARHDALDARNWLPESRLRAIGFAFNVPVGAPQAAQTYDHVPPRLAWVALEYDGAQWREIERRRALTPPDYPLPGLQSRLVPVDAAPEFEPLRRRYPTGHVIVRAVIGLSYVPTEQGGPLVHGTLREIVPSAVAVPRRLRPVLDALAGEPGIATEPRYEADVAIGRLGLPYLRALRPR